MTAMTSEYRLVHPVTSEEQVRFPVTDDLDADYDYTPVIETFQDGEWQDQDGYIATSLHSALKPKGIRPSQWRLYWDDTIWTVRQVGLRSSTAYRRAVGTR